MSDQIDNEQPQDDEPWTPPRVYLYAPIVKFAMAHATAARESHQHVIDNAAKYPQEMVNAAVKYSNEYDRAALGRRGGRLVYRRQLIGRWVYQLATLVFMGISAYLYAKLQGWV